MIPTWQEALSWIDNGGRLNVACPDGVTRQIYGYNGNTGDVLILGWNGDAFMNCSDGTLRVDFSND